MNSTLLWLLVGLGAVLLGGWRLVVLRRRKAALVAGRDSAAEAALAMARVAAPPQPAEAPAARAPREVRPVPVPVTVSIPAAAPLAAKPQADLPNGPPNGVERRSPGRLAADRVIAAEAERRQAAIAKAQEAARVEAERRAVAKASPSSTEQTVVLNPTVVAFRAPAPAAHPADAESRPLAPVVPISRAVETAADAPPAKTAEQTLVLLADDSKMVRLKTSKLLAAHGFQVVTAVDGLDAIKQLETCLPDLVITDVDMPGMDGFGLTQHLRRTARTAHVPIVMITSAEDRHREEATRAGVGLVMGKPYPEDELIAHIRSFRFTAAVEQEAAAALA